MKKGSKKGSKKVILKTPFFGKNPYDSPGYLFKKGSKNPFFTTFWTPFWRYPKWVTYLYVNCMQKHEILEKGEKRGLKKWQKTRKKNVFFLRFFCTFFSKKVLRSLRVKNDENDDFCDFVKKGVHFWTTPKKTLPKKWFLGSVFFTFWPFLDQKLAILPKWRFSATVDLRIWTLEKWPKMGHFWGSPEVAKKVFKMAIFGNFEKVESPHWCFFVKNRKKSVKTLV